MKESTGDILSRQLAMLRGIPRAPRKVATAVLEASLREAGHSVSRRTIERDLHALASRFPLGLDDRSKPYGWYWMKDARIEFLPELSLPQAVALLLAQEHLKPLLPRRLHAELADLFFEAGKAVSASGWKDWHRRTAVQAMGFSLTPPDMDAHVLAEVQQALAQRRCLSAAYRSKGSQEYRDFRIHPLGLIARGPTLFLACTLFDYDDVRQLALHRMKRAEVLADARREPKGFDFATYASSTGARIGARGPVRLVCRFDPAAAEHLMETPLSKDQRIAEVESGGRLEVIATVEDDDRLHWWLLGFGTQVEVLSPARIRRAMREELVQAAEQYSRR